MAGQGVGMTKARVIIDLDLDEYPHATTEEAVVRLINTLLIGPARAAALAGLNEVRKAPDMDDDARAMDMQAWLQRIKLTLCAEANVSVQMLPDNALISTKLPFEQRY